MGKVRLTNDSDFIVGDDKILVNVMAFLFFGIFVYGLIDSFRRGFEDMDYLSYVFILLLVPAALFLQKDVEREFISASTNRESFRMKNW